MVHRDELQDVVQAGMVLACGTALAGAGHVLRHGQGPAAAQDVHLFGRPDSLDLEQVLGIGLSVVGTGISGLWLICLTTAILGALLHRAGRPIAARRASRCTPAVMRRLAATLVGINVVAMPAIAHAAPESDQVTASPYWEVGAEADRMPAGGTVEAPPDAPQESLPAVLPAVPSESAPPSGWSPTWTPAPVPADGGLLLRQETRQPVGGTEVVVASGDSLWSIVEAHLGPLATAAEIAHAWPSWFDTNRAVIGDDPSRVLPGQVLRPPPR